jgi:primosomal protein N' (replication factor Y)
MADRIRVAEVAPDVVAQAIESTYTYLIPNGMEIGVGDAVLVPFGSQVVAGYVVTTRETRPLDLPFDPSQIRRIQAKIEGMSMPRNLVETLQFISDEYLAQLGSVVSAAMPPGIRSRVVATYTVIEPKPDARLTPAQRETLKFIVENGGSVTEQKIAAAKSLAKSSVRALVKSGFLIKSVSMAKDRITRSSMLRLSDPETIERFLTTSKRKPAQAACLIALQSAQDAIFSPAEIKALANTTDSIINKLLEAKLLVEADQEVRLTSKAPKLTDEQAVAAKELVDSIRSAQGKKFLLFGVTGSGKTEVYFRAVAEALSAGNQVLYIVPEIALTAQVVSQLRSRFGSVVAVMHSAMPEGERLRNWRRIRNGEAPVVLGARSAIFAPLENLGLIVVDEEHEASYKQDNIPRYHTRVVAEHRALITNATLVLGSATPDVETYHRAKNGQLRLLELTKRATKEKLPGVEVADLRENYRNRQPSILGQQLRSAIEETLARNEQAILFINRRAYASSLLCRDCGHVPHCGKCSVSLTFHRATRRLKCHHCGHEERAPETCSQCGGARLRTLGLGTEKVEEAVQNEFPGIGVSRLDRDVARRKGAIEQILSDFHEGRTSVLVGTQMVAKGLDFPRVSLVGVIAADTGLFIPDYRSTERTFQLLTQVAGRAGRHRPGRVVIQTFQPDHPAVVFAAKQNYEEFFESEIADRRDAGYPPFVRLVNIVVSSADRSVAVNVSNEISKHLWRVDGAAVVGPADCAIERLKSHWRRHLLVKLPLHERSSLVALPESIVKQKNVSIRIDVDPGSLM